MSDRLTQLGFYLISRGFISPEHWQLVEHVMIQTLEQNLNQLDLTSQKQFSQEITRRLYQNSISGWLQIPGHDIDGGLTHRFSTIQLLKLEFFPCALSVDNTLVIAVVQFEKPEIKQIIHQVWPQVTLKQLSISKNQLVALIDESTLGKAASNLRSTAPSLAD